MNCNTTHYRANSSSVPGDPTDVSRDTVGGLTPAFVLRAYRRQQVSARFTCPPHSDLEEGTGALTVRFGRAGANTELHFYDKKAELLSAGRTVPFDRLTRIEARLRRTAAVRAAVVIASTAEYTDPATGEVHWLLNRSFGNILKRGLRFRVAARSLARARESKNQTKIPDHRLWKAFLGADVPSVAVPELREALPEVALRDYLRYAQRCVLPAMALLAASTSPDELQALMARTRDRIRPEFLQLLDEEPSWVREAIEHEFPFLREEDHA